MKDDVACQLLSMSMQHSHRIIDFFFKDYEHSKFHVIGYLEVIRQRQINLLFVMRGVSLLIQRHSSIQNGFLVLVFRIVSAVI